MVSHSGQYPAITFCFRLPNECSTFKLCRDSFITSKPFCSSPPIGVLYLAVLLQMYTVLSVLTVTLKSLKEAIEFGTCASYSRYGVIGYIQS